MDIEKLRADAEARIKGILEKRRAKLDSISYVHGPVTYNYSSKHSEDNPKVTLYGFDIVAFAELWEEKDGVLVPKQGAGLLRGRHGNMEEWGSNEGMLVRPYISVHSLLSEQPDVLVEAVRGNLSIDYTDKPRDHYTAGVYQDSLFDATGLEMVVLSAELRPEFYAKRDQIVNFYKTLKAQPNQAAQ